MSNIERSDIYDVIDKERDYQDNKWGLEEHPIPQFVCDIDEHLRRLKNHCYNLDNLGMLDEIRKISALTVKCMEVHGYIERLDNE